MKSDGHGIGKIGSGEVQLLSTKTKPKKLDFAAGLPHGTHIGNGDDRIR